MEPITMAALATAASSGGQMASDFMNRRFNKKMEHSRRIYDIRAMGAQNRYNHPAAQMQRLKDAGLNPNLIYGGSPGQASGNSQGVPEGKAPQSQMSNPLQALGRLADFPMQKAQIDNLESTAEVNFQRAILLGV